MKIQDMFVDDINRKINGVIKVDQEDNSTEQELNEYVITRELKRHFITFSITMTMLSMRRHRISASGFPASLEVVNLTS